MNDDNNNVFGEILESAGTAAKQTGKAVVNTVSDTAKATVSQISGSDTPGLAPSQDVNAQDVVESLYEKSQPQAAAAQQPSTPASNSSNTQSKSSEELAQIEMVRKTLHDTYYQSLVNPPKQQEESVSEKLEREEKQDMVDLQEKQMEKPPELVQRAAQRVEKFPGASG